MQIGTCIALMLTGIPSQTLAAPFFAGILEFSGTHLAWLPIGVQTVLLFVAAIDCF